MSKKKSKKQREYNKKLQVMRKDLVAAIIADFYAGDGRISDETYQIAADIKKFKEKYMEG